MRPKSQRKSYMEYGKIYFWTATINKWNKLLFNDVFKMEVLNSLEYLSNHGKITVYAFIIMPNHVHFIWKMLEINGKEKPSASFLKYTAHMFKKHLAKNRSSDLAAFKVSSSNKEYEFWQKDPLAIWLFDIDVATQKLDYLHNNPIQEHWNLSSLQEQYFFSSARFYKDGIDNFGFLHNIFDEI